MTEIDVYEKGTVKLEEWEDVNYCEHSFCVDGEYLNDNEIVDLIYKLKKENNYLSEKIEKREFQIDNLLKEKRSLAFKLGKCGQRISELKKDQ